MKPSFQLFNSEKQKVLPIEKKPGDTILMYTCGPTVYNFAHIGNFRTYVFEDVLRRALKYFGYHVKQAMNLTDVDDKTIKGAIANHQTLDEFTKPFKEAFFQDLKTLNIEPVEVYPAATDHIQEMIDMIQVLLDKEIAYVGVDGSVYFSIKKFPEYGRLAHLETKELKVGASNRIQSDEYEKDAVSDFVLWKAYDPERDGKIFWQSPFGKGRPGWHIECSAMAIKHLGKTLDIHVGGIDNLFPHHENEIAQSEACTGCCFAKHWCHSEHLLVDGKKMSKSLGNFYTLRDLLNKGFTGKEVRMALLQSHYRMQLNFSISSLESARSSLKRIDACISQLITLEPKEKDHYQHSHFYQIQNAFDQAIADDLNLAQALAVLFGCIKDIQHNILENEIGLNDKKEFLQLLDKFNQVLGIMTFDTQQIPEEIIKAAEQRKIARQSKNYQESDRLRKWIEDQGYAIDDSPTGTKIRKL